IHDELSELHATIQDAVNALLRLGECVGAGIHQLRREAAARERMGDAGAHQAGADHHNLVILVEHLSCLLSQTAGLGPTTFVIVPIPSIPASTTSPGLRNRPVPWPTPAGDPVNRMSPGAKLERSSTNFTSCATFHVIS